MKKYLIENLKSIIIYILCVCIFILVFKLYHFPLQAVIYPTFLSFILIIVFSIYKYYKFKEKDNNLRHMLSIPDDMIKELNKYTTVIDNDYKNIIEKLMNENKKLNDKYISDIKDINDYYSIWVHQIKTPISAMNLKLHNEDSQVARDLMIDLLAIEQYVDMAMCYIRIGSDSNDYLFKKYDINKIVQECVSKFFSDFINKGIKLNYKLESHNVITDSKWISFVIEQILSNAVKYTDNGIIKIYMDKDLLCIEDTGCGILKEDLPQIFKKGYTGFNGRNNKNSSGIGLYLCKKICDELEHILIIDSEINRGTVVKIDFSKKYRVID